MDGDPARISSVRGSRRARWCAAGGLGVVVSVLLLVGALPAPEASAAEAPVGLGTAESYSVLGGQTVTNTGPSTLSGDLGVSPGTAITGFPPGTAAGATHAADAAAAQAQSDLVTAYNDAAGRAPTASVADDLVGQTLTGGVYNSTGPLSLSGTLTLDGQGDPNTVWIFQVASTLITASASDVNLVNGAQACHVYWQVGSSATLGTTSNFVGTIMALTSITVTTGTVVAGRALARNGQVSLDDNTFTTPDCDTTTPTTDTTSSTTPTTTTTGDTDTTSPTTTSDSDTTSPTTTTTTSDSDTTSPTTTTSDSDTTSPTTTTSDSDTTSPTTSTSDSDTTSPTTTTSDSDTTSPTSTSDSDTTSPTTTSDSGTTSSSTTTTTGTGSSDSSAETTTSSSGLGASWTDSGSNGSGRGFPDYPTGPSNLASTGASPLLGPLVGLGFLLIALGGLLLFVLRARKFRRQSE
ncbi:ice-binding family protein [Amycolatopsis carbonis]|uniref:Ice-binding family protein n=1 Tax=Amycolatopsis carbonis TaxID=715471 RepID=A0A9Y2IHT5_9PSEU|nr:ice-binding family protein [Amycolatopsis sp. 2-15]WIX79251.1 ice-binding family protein [Amycolatopsis sp. 2-15]